MTVMAGGAVFWPWTTLAKKADFSEKLHKSIVIASFDFFNILIYNHSCMKDEISKKIESLNNNIVRLDDCL